MTAVVSLLDVVPGRGDGKSPTALCTCMHRCREAIDVALDGPKLVFAYPLWELAFGLHVVASAEKETDSFRRSAEMAFSNPGLGQISHLGRHISVMCVYIALVPSPRCSSRRVRCTQSGRLRLKVATGGSRFGSPTTMTGSPSAIDSRLPVYVLFKPWPSALAG